MKADSVKRAAAAALPFAGTAVLLTLIHPPFGLAPLAWVAWVPFIAACSEQAKPRRLFRVTYLTCLVYWLVNLYWMIPVTVIGWVVFSLYTALLWPVLALGLRWCRARKVPLFAAAAVLITGTESMQGIFLGGFFWRFLGHSQYSNTTIIQIADIFGAPGVSFLLGMVNGLAAGLVVASRRKEFSRGANALHAAIVAAAVAGAVLYGRWRISQEGQYISEGPVVGAVQTNVPQSVKRSFKAGQQIFDDTMVHSKAVAAAGAELIVWPETMVQATLNPPVQAVLAEAHPWKALDAELRDHARERANVLVGAYGGKADSSGERLVERYNSAFLYRLDGRQYYKHYDKIHLVPFGEVLPLRRSFSWFYEALMKVKFIPYNFDYSLDYGSEYTVFEMLGLGPSDANGDPGRPVGSYRFSVMICYEDVVPEIGQRFALDEDGRKQVDFLVNISNDGWFVRFNEGSQEVSPSAELGQHAAICVFRAVENRLAVVRSVNTGISCVIDSSGRIRDGYISGDLPRRAFARTGMDGWFTDRIPVDSRTTFFSKHGRLLDFSCEAVVILFIISSVAARFLRPGRNGTRLPRRSNGKRTQTR